jgi:hypothetical protein
MKKENLELGIGEGILSEHFISQSISLAFIKSQFNITNKRLIVEEPNVYGIIPFGRNRSTYPLSNISNVSINRKISFKKLFIGLILMLIGLMDFSRLFLLILIGGAILFAALELLVSIQNNAGTSKAFEISPLDRNKAKQLVDELTKAIASYN